MIRGLAEALLWVNLSLHLQCYEPGALCIEALHLSLSPLCPLVLQSRHRAEGPQGAAAELRAGQSPVTYTA